MVFSNIFLFFALFLAKQLCCYVTIIWGSQSTCRCLFAAGNIFALLSFSGDALLGCHRSYRSRPTHGIGKFKYLLPKEVGRRTSLWACFPKGILKDMDAPSQEARLEGVWRNLEWWKVGWSGMRFKVPSNPNYSLKYPLTTLQKCFLLSSTFLWK